jgi:hypothetical protein
VPETLVRGHDEEYTHTSTDAAFSRRWIHSYSADIVVEEVGIMEKSPRARHRVPESISHKLASIRVRFDEDLQSNSLNFDHTSKEGINYAHSSSIKGSYATASVKAANVWYSLIMRRLMGKLIRKITRSLT